jgi:hypothetical protein
VRQTYASHGNLPVCRWMFADLSPWTLHGPASPRQTAGSSKDRRGQCGAGCLLLLSIARSLSLHSLPCRLREGTQQILLLPHTGVRAKIQIPSCSVGTTFCGMGGFPRGAPCGLAVSRLSHCGPALCSATREPCLAPGPAAAGVPAPCVVDLGARLLPLVHPQSTLTCQLVGAVGVEGA